MKLYNRAVSGYVFKSDKSPLFLKGFALLACELAALLRVCVALQLNTRFSYMLTLNALLLSADFKDCLNSVYTAIEEADFLAIDGEFSGNCIKRFCKKLRFKSSQRCVCKVTSFVGFFFFFSFFQG